MNTEAWGLSLWRWALSLQLGGATCCLHSTQFRTLHACLLVVQPCPPGPSTWLLMPNSSSFCPSVVAWPLLARSHHCRSFSPCWNTPSHLTCSLHLPTSMLPSELPDSAKSPCSLLRAAWERSLVTQRAVSVSPGQESARQHPQGLGPSSWPCRVPSY